MSSLHARSEIPELMDDLACHGQVVDQTLRELEIINRWLGGNAVTIQGVKYLLQFRKPHQRTVIADIGCGSGDMAIRIAEWSRQINRNVDVIGVDANPNIVRYAQGHAGATSGVSFQVINVLDSAFAQMKFDIVVATLFIHHFTREQLVDLFRILKRQSTTGFVVNDIHRHFLAYHSIRFLTMIFSRSAMVRYDAPLSVRRAFKRAELEEILQLAGIDKYTLRWKWAFRWQLIVTTSTSV
jgi:2-polyprenyl-3-methyl-5-hydroxy-6-metoxy-1,4-benzoquinol methylase